MAHNETLIFCLIFPNFPNNTPYIYKAKYLHASFLNMSSSISLLYNSKVLYFDTLQYFNVFYCRLRCGNAQTSSESENVRGEINVQNYEATKTTLFKDDNSTKINTPGLLFSFIELNKLLLDFSNQVPNLN